MRASFLKEVSAANLPPEPTVASHVTERDLAPLPAVVRRYLGFMRAVGRPRDWSLAISWTGRVRRTVDEPWVASDAEQYNSSLSVARIFQRRVRSNGAPLVRHETYLRGRGRERTRLFDWITLEDLQGPELDEGELVAYVNDAILFAPTMLLAAQTRWTAVDDHAFEVAFKDHERTVHATVTIDDRGAVESFVSTNRFREEQHGRVHRLVRTRWSTPIYAWTVSHERPMPTAVERVCETPQGPFAYADLRVIPERVAFNVAPTGLVRGTDVVAHLLPGPTA